MLFKLKNVGIMRRRILSYSKLYSRFRVSSYNERQVTTVDIPTIPTMSTILKVSLTPITSAIVSVIPLPGFPTNDMQMKKNEPNDTVVEINEKTVSPRKIAHVGDTSTG